ncbi:MAG: SGNH/GDSL hydrolase family protein [Saccharothrix sp.]|nr:SGNH/GDSL hydrolase family protein [Saccharothrix sp.]
MSLVVVIALSAPATAAAAEPYEWAALGDSDTTGVFVGEPRPALGSSDRDGCDRTANSYPDLVDRDLAGFPLDRPVRLTDVSCAGATIDHVVRSEQKPMSPVDPPADGWPAVEPQATRAGLGEATDVVTIGIGGNSLPLGDIVLDCLELGLRQQSCREHHENPPDGAEGIDAKLQRVRDEYARMLADVHDLAPNAEVIAVGYPTICPRAASTCEFGDLTRLGTIRADDIAWLSEVVDRINRIMSTVSSSFGDHYVDLASSTADRHVCRPAGEKWVEGLCGDAEDFWPARVAVPGAAALDCRVVGKRATLVHPNAAGHANAASHVGAAVRRALLEP